MGYEISLDRAWDELEALSPSREYIVKLFCKTYRINIEDESVLCQNCSGPADDFLAVLILHYLTGKIKHGYSQSGEWISFRDVWGGNSFYPAFREGTLHPLVESLKNDPEALQRNIIHRLGGKIMEGGDISVEITAFPDVLIKIMMWHGDEELPAEATMLFDRNLPEILSTEDIAVLLNFIVKIVVD
jgi:hypothetical protein